MIFLKDDIDNPETYHRELCSSIPTFFIYTNGNENGRQFSGNQFNEFSSFIQKMHHNLISN